MKAAYTKAAFCYFVIMKVMKLVFSLVLLIMITVLSVQFYHFYQQRRQLESDLTRVNKQYELLVRENAQLQADLNYFSNPENLAKEFKSKFDYKRPGEKLMIIVPPP